MALVSVRAGPVRLETAPTEGVCDGKPRQYYTNFLNLIPMRIKQMLLSKNVGGAIGLSLKNNSVMS